MNIYVTYLTIYSGNKLPQFYIGSSLIDKINSGYHGSVKSKKYKDIWKNELKQNPHLFKTKIISTHETRELATAKELKLQKLLNVANSPMYINMAYAAPNGFFGISTKGIPKSEKTKSKMRGNTNAKGPRKNKRSSEHNAKISKALTGRERSIEHCKAISESKKGIPQSKESNRKRSLTQTGKKRGPYKKKLNIESSGSSITSCPW